MTILKVRPTLLMRTRSVICSIKNIMLLKQGIITVCRLNQNSKKKLSWSKRNVKQQFKKCHVTLSIIYHYFCDTYETFGPLKFLFFLKLKIFEIKEKILSTKNFYMHTTLHSYEIITM